MLSPTTPGARYQFPCVPPLDYRLEMEVERVGKDTSYGFSLGFLVDGRPAEILIDSVGPSGKRTGIPWLDGVPLSFRTDLFEGQLLIPKRSSRFTLAVHRGSIELTCDANRVVSWSGDSKRIIRYRGSNVPDPVSIYLGTNSSVKFSNVFLTPVEVLEALSRFSSGSRACPMKSQCFRAIGPLRLSASTSTERAVTIGTTTGDDLRAAVVTEAPPVPIRDAGSPFVPPLAPSMNRSWA